MAMVWRVVLVGPSLSVFGGGVALARGCDRGVVAVRTVSTVLSPVVGWLPCSVVVERVVQRVVKRVVVEN